MRFLVCVGIGLVMGRGVTAATPELRGVWLTTTGYSATSPGYPLSTAGVTDQTFATLRSIGLNSAYMDVWRDGYTWFSSPTLAAIPGETRDRHPSLGTRDLLQDTLIQAHKNGMAEIGWFQYGFATQYYTSATNPLTTYMQSQGWLLQDSGGAYTDASNRYDWMNPLVPQVEQLMEGMIMDAVSKYDLDGIQFDDRLAWPVQFGYDAYTKNLYKQETGKDVPANYADPAFVAWRAQKLTAFVTKLYTDIKSKDPNLIISIAPTLYNYSYTNYCVDWPTWSKTTVVVNGQSRPLFDEYVPQVYSSTTAYFQSAWNTQVANMSPARLGQLGAGIAMDTGGGTYDWATVNKPQVDDQRATTGTEGQIWWYASDVLNTNTGNLKAYYDVADNGQAARTDQPANWRSIDLPATALGSNKYSVNVATEGFYEIVYHVGSTYTLYATQDFLGGANTVSVPGTVDGVELLIDRRPYNLIPGVTRGFSGAVTNGDWAVAGNWVGGLVPNGVGLEAQFTAATAATTVNVSSGVSVGSLLFDSAAPYTIGGAGTITVGVASRGGAIGVNRGQDVVTVPLVLARDTTVTTNGGAMLTMGTIGGNASLIKAGAGVLRAGSVQLGGMQVNAGQFGLMPSTVASNLGTLVVSTGAGVDIATDTLVVAGTGVDSIRQYLRDGRIFSSGVDPQHLMAVGYLVDSASGAVTLKQVLAGDANMDGRLDADDYALIDRGYAKHSSVWASGDFNDDGQVDGADYLVIDRVAGIKAGGLSEGLLAEREAQFGAGYVSELVASVPEPSGLGLVGIAWLRCIRRSRRV